MDKRPLITFLILSVVAVAVGVVLLARAAHILALETNLPTQGIRTKARVVAARYNELGYLNSRSYDDESDSYLDVEYNSGYWSSFHVPHDMLKATPVGSWVELTYSPEDPRVAELQGQMGRPAASQGYFLAGGSVIAGGVILAIYSTLRYFSQLRGVD